MGRNSKHQGKFRKPSFQWMEKPQFGRHGAATRPANRSNRHIRALISPAQHGISPDGKGHQIIAFPERRGIVTVLDWPTSGSEGHVRLRPSRTWRWSQSWQNVLFVHWEVSADWLRAMLPRGVDLDRWQGSSWVSVIAFR